ncbi:MAG: ATP-binding protein [Verrucomicrobiota bacterium]
MSLSLKWQIQFWYAFIILALLSLLGVGFYRYEKSHRIDAVDEQLVRFIPVLLGPGGTRGSPQGRAPRNSAHTRATDTANPVPDGWTRRNPGSAFAMPGIPKFVSKLHENRFEFFDEQIVPLGFYARMDFKVGHREDFISTNFPEIEIPDAHYTGQLSRTRDGRYREFLHEVPGMRAVIGYDMEMLSAELSLLKNQIAGSIAGLFALSIAVGYLLVSRSIRPLKEITTTTHDIASAKLDARIPESRTTDASELKTLTADLNDAFAQLEVLFERQKRFTADASHELRTPLATLLSQIEHGLKRPRTIEEHTKILEVCERSTGRINGIIEQLLELARYDADNVQINRQFVNVDTMLQALAEELTPSVEKNGSRLLVDLVACEVECDPFLIEQVVINFVNNAIQHNSEPVVIDIRCRKTNKSVIIEVVDHGKGISPENIEKLFDRFFQEDRSRTQKGQKCNVGLGLSISQAIIQAHGGSIHVQSQPQVETVFSIQLSMATRPL